jgi:hypothetical protein
VSANTQLDVALDDGTARATDVSDSGAVPEPRFENTGERPVLILDGEKLVGAKQNRVLNLTILAPAKEVIIIPISCVEAGRWAEISKESELRYNQIEFDESLDRRELVREGRGRIERHRS